MRNIIIAAVVILACFTRIGLATLAAVALYLLVTGKDS
jgi:hypothetical protein